MPTYRGALLRILSNLCKQIATTEEVARAAISENERRHAVDRIAELQAALLQVQKEFQKQPSQDDEIADVLCDFREGSREQPSGER